MKPVKKVKKGYLTWNENWIYNHRHVNLTPWRSMLPRRIRFHYRLDILVRYYYRKWFNKPLKYEDLLKGARDACRDASQLNVGSWFNDKYKII